MSKRRFKEHERVAVYNAHGGECLHCLEPCTLEEMEIDHIIPESISPEKLREVGKLFELPEDFDVNSFENWAPSHPKCNRKKSNKIFLTSTLMVQILQQARERGESARKFAATEITQRNIARAKSDIKRAAENGQLSREEIIGFTKQLLETIQPEELGFVQAVSFNALSLHSDGFFEFDFGRMSYSLSVRRDAKDDTTIVTMSGQGTIKFMDVLEVEYSVRAETSSSGFAIFDINIGRVVHTQQQLFVEAIATRMREGGAVYIPKIDFSRGSVLPPRPEFDIVISLEALDDPKLDREPTDESEGS